MLVTLQKNNGSDAGLWYASMIFASSGRVSSWTRTKDRAQTIDLALASKVAGFYQTHKIDGSVRLLEGEDPVEVEPAAAGAPVLAGAPEG